jgi:hypothetical protein
LLEIAPRNSNRIPGGTGLAFGAYFVWWSLQVLDRLTPEYDARTAVVARAS